MDKTTGSEFGDDGTTMDKWLPYFIQTADPQFPTGAYAHSFALEEMVALGVVHDADTLARFLAHEAAEQLASLELPCLRVAYEMALNGKLDEILQLDAEMDAHLLANESRSTSKKLGRQRLKLLNNLYGSVLISAFYQKCVKGETSAHQAIVAGVQAAHWKCPMRAALWAHLYQLYSQILQASMKLIRIGQEGCQQLLTSALAKADSIINESLCVSREEMGTSLPLLDIAASRHATAFSRLFIS